MSDAIAQLEFRVTGVNNAKKEVNDFHQTVTRGMTASEKSVASAIGGMVAQYMSLAVAVRATQKALSSGIEFNKFVENTTMSFSVMMKSAEKAKGQMKDLYDFAVNSPLTFEETAKSSKQLMAYGFAAEELIPTMKNLGAVAIATGHSLDDISYVYGTLKSQGRAYSRDLMQFGMRGIPIYEELAKVLGVNTNQIQKMASEGKIGFKEVEKAFQNMTSNGGRFAGILEGYMDTLTGKMSMLSDIAQQSAGKATGGIFDALKASVEDLTEVIQSEGMQDFFATMAVDLGHVAKAVSEVLVALIKLAPLLSVLLKWVLAIGVGIAVFKGIPAMMFAIGDMAVKAAIGMQSLGVAIAGGTSAVASMTTGIGLLAAASKAFIIANPWFVILMGLAAVGGTILTIMHVNADKARNSEDAKVRAGQLEKDLKSAKAMGGFDGIEAPVKVMAKIIQNTASEYKLAEGAVANLYIKQGLLTRSTWEAYQASEAYRKSYSEGLKAYGAGKSANGKDVEASQAEFFASQTGNDMSTYLEIDPAEFTAKGRRAARELIASFAAERDANKAIWEGLYVPNGKYAEDLKKEAEALGVSLTASGDVQGGMEYMNKSGFSPEIRARIAAITKELKGLGGVLDKLKKSWTDAEWRVKVTNTQTDDLELQKEKALYAAEEEYAGKAGMEEEFQRVRANIIKYYNKEIQKDQYDVMSKGNAKYFDDLRASAAKAMNTHNGPNATDQEKRDALQEQASSTMQAQLQGTETGTLMAGGDPLTMLIEAFAKMLLSVENVNKVLNPFSTLMESVKGIIEGPLNNALEPLVFLLEMVGEVVGQLLTPFISWLKILTTLIYASPAVMMLIASLQMLGSAFAWFNDYVIVPIANQLVKIVNAIIRQLNKIPGVHIKYLDTLKKTTYSLETLTGVVDRMKDSLGQTISYLTNKINAAVDSQLSSLQKLYQVGALSGSQYEAKAAALDAQKIATSDTRVSDADKALTYGAGMYERLARLVILQEDLAKGKYTLERQKQMLEDAGLMSDTDEAIMTRAVLSALIAYNAATTTSTAILPVIESTEARMAREWAAMEALIASYGNNISNKEMKSFSTQTSGYNQDTVKKFVDMLLADIMKGLGDFGRPLYIPIHLATGTGSVPNDMNAVVHKGEGIIPKTFMDSIRSGDLSLSSKRNSSGNGVTVIVNVNGSVTAEKDLASTIARQINTQRSRGLLTV